MKRILLVMVIVLLVSTAVSAQLPPQGYIGLFADTGRNTWCINDTGQFPFYCFVLPPEGGMDSIEMSTVLSSANLAVFGLVYHPDIILTMGSFPGDLVATFGNCQNAWTQLFSATVFIMGVDPESVTLGAHSLGDYPLILTCFVPPDLGVETEAIIWTHLYTNYVVCPDYANQESTWGAIKNMYE